SAPKSSNLSTTTLCATARCSSQGAAQQDVQRLFELEHTVQAGPFATEEIYVIGVLDTLYPDPNFVRVGILKEVFICSLVPRLNTDENQRQHLRDEHLLVNEGNRIIDLPPFQGRWLDRL